MFKRVEIEGKKRELENQTKGVKGGGQQVEPGAEKNRAFGLKKQNKMNI